MLPMLCDILVLIIFLQLLFSGHLSESILFTYNARATNGQLCLQASPNDTSAYFESATHASMVEVSAESCFYSYVATFVHL